MLPWHRIQPLVRYTMMSLFPCRILSSLTRTNLISSTPAFLVDCGVDVHHNTTSQLVSYNDECMTVLKSAGIDY
jgi:hypothetical protein